MENWELFEIECLDFLKSTYFDLPYYFIRKGGSDSTKSDIEIYNKQNNKKLLSVEAKLSPSQCGQFVVHYFDNKFILSEKGKYINEFTESIIKHINEKEISNFDSGLVKLDVGTDLIIDWVKSHYKSKDCQFFITSNKLGGDLVCIPLNYLQDYFSFSCVMRRKKSGTSDVPLKELQSSIQIVNDSLKTYGYNIIGNSYENKKLNITVDKKIQSKNHQYSNKNHFLSETDSENVYRVKKRSKTNNINIIFSIIYNNNKRVSGLDELISTLNSLL